MNLEFEGHTRLQMTLHHMRHYRKEHHSQTQLEFLFQNVFLKPLCFPVLKLNACQSRSNRSSTWVVRCMVIAFSWRFVYSNAHKAIFLVSWTLSFHCQGNFGARVSVGPSEASLTLYGHAWKQDINETPVKELRVLLLETNNGPCRSRSGNKVNKEFWDMKGHQRDFKDEDETHKMQIDF